jgi:diguanylate cyclase (GGDEF)-like protein
MTHRLLNMHAEYIYRKLLTSSPDGIVIVNKSSRILCINTVAKEILKSESVDAGDKITDYIQEYDFKTNYKQHEVTVKSGGKDAYLTITQHPIDAADADSAKLVIITDVTSALQKIKREKDMLIEISAVDQLTGLYNKRFLEDTYEAGSQEQNSEPKAVLFIDVDGFKSINDLYGHVIGDLILRSVAVSIKDSVGGGAHTIRFGGDEFVVIFQNTGADAAYLAAEDIRRKVNALDFSQCDEALKITLSIGVAEGVLSVRELIIRADKAMYRSKSNGKNMTTIYRKADHPEA